MGTRTVVALSSLAILAVAAGIYVLSGPAHAPSAATSGSWAVEDRHAAIERSVLDAARRQIAEHADGTANNVAARPAPRPRLADDEVVDSEGAYAGNAPALPHGYSFSIAPESMAQAPYRAPSLDATPSVDDSLDWLFAAGAAKSVSSTGAQLQRDWVFGWVRLAHGASRRAVDSALKPLGIEVLGASGRLLRAELPVDEASLSAALGLDAVAGIGVVPAKRKVPAEFAARVRVTPLRQVPVVVTLMDDDPQGRWRRTLQALGAVVGRFDADVRAYAANVDAAALDAIVATDFVLAVEPMPLYQVAHDTAVPAMGADAVRVHAQAPGLFRGMAGASVPIGVMDSGLNTNHLDIAMHRQSICGTNFFDEEGAQKIEDADLWVDEDGHGTHVTGTIAGNGFVTAKYAGMAPGVAHIRFAKVLGRLGYGFGEGIRRGMDFLARPTACGGSEAVKPLVVNMSLALSNRWWQGRGTGERKLDAIVWAHRQLYVVAQSNDNIHGFSNFGAAKNSLSVGAIHDSGELAGFSSWGPTFDGRLAPQVVATGVDVYSAAGNGSRGGYVASSGTSMASPAVAGVAALVMDAVAGYREQPALTRARLMASAIKPAAWLDAPLAFPSTNSGGPGLLQMQYGLGKASARTSVLQRTRRDGWVNRAVSLTLRNDSYGFRDIEVPAGASQLTIVLTWDEPPADTIGSTVLNDLDLWLDQGADCAEAACGEHSSISRRDNVEWIIVRDPAPGTYRVRVVPHRVYTAPPRAGLAWTVVRGASTPNLRLAVDEVRPMGERRFQVALSLSADAYVAAGAQIAQDACRVEDGASEEAQNTCSPNSRISLVTAEDGVENSPPPTTSVDSAWLGEVGVGERQRVEYDVDMSDTPSAARLYFTASAWNAHGATASVPIPASADLSDAGEPPAEVPSPANDDFAAAERLDGATGSVASDLLATTFEPGEPLPVPYSDRRPSGSVWYTWQAPANGAVHFRVSPTDGAASDGAGQIDVLQGPQGHGLAGLTQLASREWGVSFFADQGETYWIRVSHLSANDAHPFMLRWSQGPRPANDDFMAATRLRGREGETTGHNVGATLQPYEQFGRLAATVWYRWTAPEDGAWRFATDSNESKVLVFTGSGLDSLRLVSGQPEGDQFVPVKAGAEYRIAVAARNAFASGRDFRLEWQPAEREEGNDDFAHATELTGATGEESVFVGDSVEPDEPEQSGVRTRWWAWTAPASGRFVWRLTNTASNELLVAVFAPSDAEAPASDVAPAIETLQLLASTAPRITATELGFDAVEGRRYWISVGFHADDLAAFNVLGDATLEWGEAPANDILALAAPLVGSSGSATVSNHWGSLEQGESSGALGHSSLWWEFTPDATGWYRFHVDDAPSASLGAYRASGVGLDGLELVARSHGGWRSPDEEDAVSALFHAAEGSRYVIRLGTRGEEAGAESTLRWAPADAPAWLRYVGRLPASALGLANEALDAVPAMAFEDRGSALYLGSSQGLHVLRRDQDAGTLGPVRVLEMGRPDGLLWDAHRTRLYAYANCAWRQLAPRGDSRTELRDEGALDVSGDDSPDCDVRRVFLDPSGAFLHRAETWGLHVYALDDAGLSLVQSVEFDNNVKDALISGDGEHIYVLADRAALRLFRRDVDDGTLAGAGEINLAMEEYSDIEFSAIERIADAANAYLVALKYDSTVLAYDLSAGGAAPLHVDTLDALVGVVNADWNRGGKCSVGAPRLGALALDVFCQDSAFSAAVRRADEASVLAATDYVANAQADRFNNYIPQFTPQVLVTSPDGRHAYVYAEGDILIFERVGNRPPATQAAAAPPSAQQPLALDAAPARAGSPRSTAQRKSG